MRMALMLALGAAGVAALAVPASAQRGPPGPRDAGPDGGFGMRSGGVERILQLREELELTDEQISALNEIRAEALERRQAEFAFMMELRSDLQAGEITRSQMREALAERREAHQGRAEPDRERLRGVLSEEQLDALADRGRMQARRDGVRGRRPGAGMGQRGPRTLRGGRGFAPPARFRRGGPRARTWGLAPRGGFRRR